MGQIIVLDQNMVNMIAAGEVIERPASVVKELMENSIDAGATKITVAVEDGGRKLMSVTDDGQGMDGEDLARAFEPHTTSKIKRSSDLLGISTLGFRGEALASIASVAQVKAVSRPRTEGREQKTEDRGQSVSDGIRHEGRGTQYENGANCIEIDCGKKGPGSGKDGASPCSGDYGTTIQVRDLFYKLPARRKFLRTANTEMSHITEQFIRLALANAASQAREGLDMTLKANNREVFRLLSKQGLAERIGEIFPMLPRENLIETQSSEKGLRIFALLGKPSISRTNSKFQYTFLNSRFIRDKFITHAIKEAYRGTLEPNRYPVAFLFIEMPYEDYDVNVHPTKIEVRFYNSNLVHSQVLGCLREKLLATNLETEAQLPGAKHFSGREGAAGGGYRSGKIADAMAEFFKRHKAIQTQQQFEPASRKHFAGPVGGQITESRTVSPGEQVGTIQRQFLQIHDSFIVAQTDEGFVIIDQHALHERIIYERLCRRTREGKLESQKLLIPESFEVTASGAEALETNAELVEKLGIELVPFGPRTMAIQAFPTLLSKASPLEFIQDLIDLLDQKDTGRDTERLLDEVLNMAACKAAIKAGQKLSPFEIEQLLADRETTESASRCPHGRPTTIKFSISDLEKQFKRT